MPATNIYDLLPIPQGVEEPHAYQIFGIEDGEQDLAVISGKIREIVGNLKQQKETTDPKLWTKAAKLAQQARLTLANPKTKAKLDARFGIITDEPDIPASSDPLSSILPSADPLAGMLPAADPLGGADPLAAILPPETETPETETSEPEPTPSQPTSSEASAANDMPAGIFGTPDQKSPTESVTNGTTNEIPLVVPAQETVVSSGGRNPHRRPKPILGLMMFGTFSVGMVTIIGILIWFMVYRGEVAITQTDGSLTISTTGKNAKSKSNGESKKPARGKATPEPLEPDPVMGTLGPSKKKPSKNGKMSDLEKEIKNGPPVKEPDPKPTKPMADPEPKPPVVPKEPAITDEMIAEADKQLANVSMLIKTAKWSEMKDAAEKASELPMNDEQKNQAEALYELADLASYYRGGIEKSVASINIGNDFEVTKDLRVIVVEKGDDFIAIQFNARKKTYKFDELPFALAHKLATFSIPASPTQIAAKSVYQALCPKANEENREEAIQWLNELSDVDGANPKRLAETLKKMFK